jgi:hypothetical protein
MTAFHVAQSEIELETKFSPRLWSIYHDVPSLYEPLLDRLAYAGLSATDLRHETGDGSIGGTSLLFWLFGLQMQVHLKVESFQVRIPNLRQIAFSKASETVEAIRGAIRQTVGSQVSFISHTVTYSCHGKPEGLKSVEIIRRLVPNLPQIDEFGECVGGGAAFYYSGRLPFLSVGITVDVSRIVPDGLFLRAIFLVDKSPESVDALAKVCDKGITSVLDKFELTCTEPWI